MSESEPKIPPIPSMKLRIAFDVGGVLTKYPDVFKALLKWLHDYTGVEVFIVSDMHPVQKIIDMLELNGLSFFKHKVHSADFKTHGELCKTVLCEQLGIDILIDDFTGYVAAGKFVRLLVMPDPVEPYYHDTWKTDGSEGDFGRRRKPATLVQPPAPPEA